MTQQPIFGFTAPQDIKLELNSNGIVLKAGSIITFPNGTQIQITTDKTQSGGWGGVGEKQYLFMTPNYGLLAYKSQYTYSGPTAPTVFQPGGYAIWYDTVNNQVKWTSNSGSTWTGGYSLPLAIVQESVSDGLIDKIDQVFNGVGYMGSSLFVLPGVEGFCPNGKDGFKNLFQTVTHNSLTVYNITSSKTNQIMYFNASSNFLWTTFEIVNELPDEEDMVVWKRYYNKQDNFVYTYDGNSIIKQYAVPYGYVTTASSSPYTITSFDVVNPFATITPHIVSDYAKYLANLLIIQYNSKPKAQATIESIGSMFPDELILSVRDGFSLETATGKQLDILSKYIGAERGYTDSNSNKAVLTDDEFRILLKLKIIVNTGTASLYGLETSLYNLFGTGIRVVEGKDAGGNPNMTLTYYIRSDWANIGLAAVQQNILPHPTGVGYTYNLASPTKYFGFIEYTDTSHPFTTGFMDYNDPTKQGEMFTYDKQIG